MGLGRYLPAALKQRLVSARYRARSALLRNFFAFTPEDLIRELRRLGIAPGDTVIAHTSFARFEGFRGGISQAIQALQTAVGERGNLLLPTLPFSGSAYEYVSAGRITDVARTPSHMGLLTEIFRRLPGVRRSIHPTHPVAVWGERGEELIRDHYRSPTPCGQGSPFHRLLEHQGKILLAGVDIRSMTFFHYMEEVLEPSMPFSPFTTEWFDLQTRGVDGRLYPTHTRLYDPAVSSRRDVRLMVDPLRRAGFWKEGKVGRLQLIVLSAVDVAEALHSMAGRGEYCYAPAEHGARS